MITKRIKLEDANQAFEDVLQGNVARSIIVFD
jgi:Zn-dependent alcohol dehydrogenase